MSSTVARLSLTALFSLSLPAMADTIPGCDMNELAKLPVTYYGQARLPVIPASFDDKPGMLLLDFGKNESTLNKDGMKKLGVTLSSSSTTVPGVNLETAYIKQLMVGQNTAKGWFVVLDTADEEISMQGGAGLLFKSDMEIALADGYVKFFKPSGCRKASLAYWDPKAFAVPMDGDAGGTERRVWMKAMVNGHAVDALISPSTPVSTMDSIAAARMGITPQMPGAVELEAVTSWRDAKQRVWSLPAKTITLGSYTMNDVTLRVMNMTLSGEMLVLGADFLRRHRVLISPGQRKVYLTPNPAGQSGMADPSR